MLKTGRKTTWDKIKIGEIFAWNGCWVIFMKTSEHKCISLGGAGGENILLESQYNEEVIEEFDERRNTIYKLPLATQRLWRED